MTRKLSHANLAEAEYLLQELQAMLDHLPAAGQGEDSPEYQRILAQYTRLKNKITALGQSPSPAPRIESLLGPSSREGFTHQGEEVTRLQELLVRLGHDLAVSGQYDSKTFLAVRTLQKANGLTGTGMADAKTLPLINQLLAGQVVPD